MSQFTVRVELHDAQWADYDVLHAAMEDRGFSRIIVGDGGSTYHLPWAEYNCTSSLTSSEICDIAQEIAGSAGRSSSVLVTNAIDRAWSGLSLVRS